MYESKNIIKHHHEKLNEIIIISEGIEMKEEKNNNNEKKEHEWGEFLKRRPKSKIYWVLLELPNVGNILLVLYVM